MYVLIYPLFNSKTIKVPMSYISRIKSGNLEKPTLEKHEFRENFFGGNEFKFEAWTFDFFPLHCLITYNRTTVRRKSNLPQQKSIFF